MPEYTPRLPDRKRKNAVSSRKRSQSVYLCSGDFDRNVNKMGFEVKPLSYRVEGATMNSTSDKRGTENGRCGTDRADDGGGMPETVWNAEGEDMPDSETDGGALLYGASKGRKAYDSRYLRETCGNAGILSRHLQHRRTGGEVRRIGKHSVQRHPLGRSRIPADLRSRT